MIGLLCVFGVLFLWVLYLIGNSCWLVCRLDLFSYDWLLLNGVIIGGLVLLLVLMVFIGYIGSYMVV